VLSGWEDGAGAEDAFELTFAEDDMSVDEVVNQVLQTLDSMTVAELGRALGITGEDPAEPEAIVEGPAGLGVDDLRARTAGIRAALLGNSGDGGLSPLLDHDVVEQVAAELDGIDAALDALDSSLEDAIEEDPQAVTSVRQAMEELKKTVLTDVVGELGVAIGFSDADGDSSG